LPIWTAAYFNYAYRLRFNATGANRLAIGIGAGFVHGGYDESGINLDEPEAVSLESRFLPDVRLGLFYYAPQYFIGAGAENLLASLVANDAWYIPPARHYYIQGGGLIPLDDAFLLKPSTLIKTAANAENQAWTIDLNAAVIVAEQFSIGASYRTGFFTGSDHASNLPSRNSIIGLAEFMTKSNIRIGYSFDYPLSSTINNLGGTHEISIGYS